RGRLPPSCSSSASPCGPRDTAQAPSGYSRTRTLRPSETAASTTARSTGAGSSSAHSVPPIKRRDRRALKQREPAYLSSAKGGRSGEALQGGSDGNADRERPRYRTWERL